MQHKYCLDLFLSSSVTAKMGSGVSIQRQETGMLALCAQILFWVSVSGEKDPNVP